MNKTKKLLSIVLAVVIAFSALSVMGSAVGKASYKTVANLEALDAYSPYGQVTRLSSEERMSIIFDSLDTLLFGANINMGELFNILGLSLTVDLRSIDALCRTVDNVHELLNHWLVGTVKGLLGVIGQVEIGTWQTGMTRDGTAQLKIVEELLELLSANKDVVYDVLSSGTLDLGLASGAVGDLDLSIIADLPGLIKGLVFPMIERWDDTLALIQTYDQRSTGNGNVENTVNERVNKLFSDNMSITTVKYDVNGNMTSEHTGMPIQTSVPGKPTADSPRYVYVVNGTTPGSVMTLYHIVDAKEAADSVKANEADSEVPVLTAYTYVKEEQTYVMTQEVPGSETYVWQATDEWGNKWSMKWYNDDSPFLPSFKGQTVELSNDAVSAGDLLYKFIPYVFQDMAPVVLNGSLKKILAEFFGAEWKYVGDVVESGDKYALDDAAKAAIPDADESNALFTKAQEEYLWEWSDYAVVNGNHYWRFQDQIWAANLDYTNNYFGIINWNYKIEDTFMNEFIPADDSNANVRILSNVNNFIVKLANTVLAESAATTDRFDETIQWTRPALVNGDNSNLIPNVKLLAQTIIGHAPQHIFGSDWDTNERCYVELMLAGTEKGVQCAEADENGIILTGIAAHLVDMIMPSMTLPGASDLVDSKATVGAILAAVVREFAAQLVPEYNYDALIYADFGTTTADPDKTFIDPVAAGLATSGEGALGYWLDVLLTMGIDIGYEYIRAFADIGEDSTEVACILGADVNYMHAGGTYVAGTTQAQLNAHWEGMLDYIIDWALTTNKEWTYKMANLVDTTGLTVSLGTVEDPWPKLDKIIDGILPIINEILTIAPDEGQTELEHFLREDLILGIVNLEWAHLIDTVKFDGANKYFRTGNVLDQLAKLVKGIVNPIFAKVGGGSFQLIPADIKDFDSLANQTNIAKLAQGLLGALYPAYQNGLFDTVLPFLNFFIGWKVDPQVLAEPIVTYNFRDGNNYVYAWDNFKTANGESKISFLNNSSGMLEIHRDSSVVDHEYAIQIKRVEHDGKGTYNFKYSDGNGYVSPYETVEIIFDTTSNFVEEEVVTFTIVYEYLGKDGKGIGGELYLDKTVLVTNKFEDAQVKTPATGVDNKTWAGEYNTYVFSEDIENTIVNYASTVYYNNNLAIEGTSKVNGYQAPAQIQIGGDSCNPVYGPEGWPDYDEHAKEGYFTFRTQDESGFAAIKSKKDPVSGSGYFFKKGTVNPAEGQDYPYGVYGFPRTVVQYGSSQKVFKHTFIHYDDYGIAEMHAEYEAKGISERNINTADSAAVAAYKTYETAYKNLVKLATYPKMTKLNNNADSDYVEVIMPQIKTAMEAMDIAYENLKEYLVDAQSTAGADAAIPTYVKALEAQLALDDGDGEIEVNYTDYEYYEYFNYADLRTEARNLVKSYYAPELLDRYYIEGSGISQAELENVIAAEANDAIAAGLQASVRERDQAELDASATAVSEWRQPAYTKLHVDDLTSRLAYYKSFLTGKEEPDAHLYFLSQEIAHIDAQQFNEADYTEDSWANFAKRLAEAKEMKAKAEAEGVNEKNSQIFSAKWELMVARKNLLLKTDSLIQSGGPNGEGGTEALEDNIKAANEIFALAYDEIELSEAGLALAADPAEAKKIALGHLIQGLGYEYKGEDGNTWNLYSGSAIEYASVDRHKRQSNQNKVDACNANLEACIAYFVTEVAAPEFVAVEGTTGAFGEVTTDETTGITTGYIFGVAAGDAAENYFALVDETTGTVEWSLGTASVTNGTGAIATVKDTAGNTIAVFTLVVFGDVNGDAEVTGADYNFIFNASLGATIPGDANTFAADVNGDASVTGADYNFVFNASLGADITVNPYAA